MEHEHAHSQVTDAHVRARRDLSLPVDRALATAQAKRQRAHHNLSPTTSRTSPTSPCDGPSVSRLDVWTSHATYSKHLYEILMPREPLQPRQPVLLVTIVREPKQRWRPRVRMHARNATHTRTHAHVLMGGPRMLARTRTRTHTHTHTRQDGCLHLSSTRSHAVRWDADG